MDLACETGEAESAGNQRTSVGNQPASKWAKNVDPHMDGAF